MLSAIIGGKHHAIAVTFIEWAGAGEQNIVIDWTVVRDGEAAAAIASTIISAPRSFVGRTAIGAAIDFAVQRLQASPGRGRNGASSTSPATAPAIPAAPVTEARDEAVAAGITINGLAIINTRSSPGYAFHTQPPGGLPKYYRENVIGGPGAFLITVENFHSFADAITRKLVAEIAGIPAPPRGGWPACGSPRASGGAGRVARPAPAACSLVGRPPSSEQRALARNRAAPAVPVPCP